jgi:hypothetical protein
MVRGCLHVKDCQKIGEMALPVSIVDDEGFSWVVLDGPVDEGFLSRLVVELLSLARPYGAGFGVAEIEKDRPLDDVVASALLKSRTPYYGSSRPNDTQYLFDYISGHRIKVRCLPLGLSPDHHRSMLKPYDGKPIVTSNTFDDMYGKGALFNAVKLALL